jgi:hypothetical protein
MVSTLVNTCKGFTLDGKQCHRKTKGNFCYQHRVNFMQEKPLECIICLESISTQKRALECGHWIHKRCIIKSAKAECPLCRTPLHLGLRARQQINKLATLRAREQFEDEERELIEEYRSEIFNPQIQEYIHNIIGYLLEDNDNINIVDVMDAIFTDYSDNINIVDVIDAILNGDYDSAG